MRLRILALLLLLQLPGVAAWYNSGWAYRAKVTTQNGKIDADLTDYPIYVNLADMGAGHGIWTHVLSTGADIRVTSSDGTTEVPIEVVAIDTAAKTGELHFKASGTLSGTSNADYYIYYGNGDAAAYGTTATYGRNNVWTQYKAVFHFQGDPSGSSPQLVDASGVQVGGVTNGAMTSGDAVAGIVGKAWDFDGTNDQVTLGNGRALYMNGGGLTWSVSLWSLRNTIVAGAMLFQARTGTSPYPGFHSFYGSGSPLQIGMSAADTSQQLINTTAAPSSTATWYHYDWTRDGPGTKINWYYNGAIDASVNNVTTTKTWSNTPATMVSLACYKQFQNQFINGQFDEMRFSNDVKTATWVSTTHNNQSSPSTFYTLGAEEVPSAASTSTGLGFGGMF
jgi:hypothetical protein